MKIWEIYTLRFFPQGRQGGWSKSSFISFAPPCLSVNTSYNLDSICTSRSLFFLNINWIFSKVLPNSKSLTWSNSWHPAPSISFGEWRWQFIHLYLVTQQTSIFQKPRLSHISAFNRVGCLATTKGTGKPEEGTRQRYFITKNELCYVCLVAFKVTK